VKIENEKVIAGLSCGQVLDRLSDYLDGELSAEERERLEAHLRGCDGCARFGGELREVVGLLRSQLARSPRLPDGFGDRLRRALASEPRER
jgi:anti-sigma factor RsiW